MTDTSSWPWPLSAVLEAAAGVGETVATGAATATDYVVDQTVDALADKAPGLTSDAEQAERERRKRERQEQAAKIGRTVGPLALAGLAGYVGYRLDVGGRRR
jgi:hypothetical protein